MYDVGYFIARSGNVIAETYWRGEIRFTEFADDEAAKDWLSGSGKVHVRFNEIYEYASVTEILEQ